MLTKTETSGLAVERAGAGPEARRALWALDVVFFALAATFIVLSPCGHWRNWMVGVKMWDKCDPGGAYVGSGLYILGDMEAAAFVGHPGLPLQLLAGTFAQAGYGLHRLAGGDLPYMEFWVRNIRWLFMATGLAVALVHVVSFHVLYAFTRKLLEDGRAAFLAVLAYATLLPTLSYATRISVEPFLVSLFLLTLLTLWGVEEALGEGRRKRAYGMAVLAGLAATAALLTKIHLAGPLVPFGLGMLLLQGRGDGRRLVERVRGKLGLGAAYAASALAWFTLGSVKIDWTRFFVFWRKMSPGAIAYAEATGETVYNYRPDAGSVTAGMISALKKNLAAYVPGFTPMGIFTIAEGAFLVIAVAGTVWYWRAHPERRRLVWWPALYCLCIAPVLCYKGWWHYFFIPLSVASVFFGFCVAEGVKRLGRRPALEGWGWVWGVAVVLLVHAVGMAFVADSKMYDVAYYRREIRPFHEALALVGKKQRIAVVGRSPRYRIDPHGIAPGWVQPHTAFHDAWEGLFVLVTPPAKISGRWAKQQKVGVVVDTRRESVEALTLKQWAERQKKER
jgi:hypothetical protein